MSSIATHGKSSRREKRSDKELCPYGSAKPLDILGSFIAVGISLVKAEFIVIQDKEQALLRLQQQQNLESNFLSEADTFTNYEMYFNGV